MEALSSREKQVLELIGKEFTTLQIAEILQISKATVETHRASMFKKLEVVNMVGLVKYAINEGLIK